MAKVTQVKRSITRRVPKIPSGYHKCYNCGGDGICKNKTKRKRT